MDSKVPLDLVVSGLIIEGWFKLCHLEQLHTNTSTDVFSPASDSMVTRHSICPCCPP